jgi:hypothetical protein
MAFTKMVFKWVMAQRKLLVYNNYIDQARGFGIFDSGGGHLLQQHHFK